MVIEQGKNFGDVSSPETKRVALSTPELKFRDEWLRQAQKYIKLGFHKELGLSEQEYLDSLPKFGPQPENFKGRFDIPIMVETRISVKRQCELAGIEYCLDVVDVGWPSAFPYGDWPNDSKGYKTPNVPYITWMQDGASNLGESVDIVREKLAKDERGATIFGGIAFYLAQPKVLEHHFMDLPGTEVVPYRNPCLDSWDGQPRLGWHRIDRFSPDDGSASCGRN